MARKAKKRTTRTRKPKEKWVALYTSCGDETQLEVVVDYNYSTDGRVFSSEADAKAGLQHFMESNGYEGGSAYIAKVMDVGKSKGFDWGQSSLS